MIVVELPVSNFLPISYQKQVTFNRAKEGQCEKKKNIWIIRKRCNMDNRGQFLKNSAIWCQFIKTVQ
jgi:hypothetical protein